MGEPWIRVHANVADKPIVWRAVDALGISENEAVGLLVRFWGKTSQHGTDGRVNHLSDVQLENWAGWRGKRGQFATFVRAVHIDADGRVNEWDEYAGKLEIRRARERDRKRMSRGQSSGCHADSPADVPDVVTRTVQPARANDTKRYDTKRSNTEKTTLGHFASVWGRYPKRTGSNPRRDAEQAWRARELEGVDPLVMVAGFERYLAHVEATGKIGTEFVLQGRTFFGPSRRFEEPWDVPSSNDTDLLAQQIATETADEAWLASRGAR